MYTGCACVWGSSEDSTAACCWAARHVLQRRFCFLSPHHQRSGSLQPWSLFLCVCGLASWLAGTFSRSSACLRDKTGGQGSMWALSQRATSTPVCVWVRKKTTKKQCFCTSNARELHSHITSQCHLKSATATSSYFRLLHCPLVYEQCSAISEKLLSLIVFCFITTSLVCSNYHRSILSIQPLGNTHTHTHTAPVCVCVWELGQLLLLFITLLARGIMKIPCKIGTSVCAHTHTHPKNPCPLQRLQTDGAANVLLRHTKICFRRLHAKTHCWCDSFSAITGPATAVDQCQEFTSLFYANICNKIICFNSISNQILSSVDIKVGSNVAF